MKNNHITQKIAAGLLSSALIFSYGTSAVFAGEVESEATENSKVTVKSLSEQQNTEKVKVSPLSDLQEPTYTLEDELGAPSLIPGDFFYFVKKIAEQIRLAFTFNDYKEAQLLSKFAAARIAEANSLLAGGEAEEAKKLLKEAVATQELAGEKLTNVEDSNSETTENNRNEQEAAADEDEQTEASAQSIKENKAVEHNLANNVDALLAVLNKIENPKAQQAIMKNIQKSFEKLEKKFKKLAESETQFTEKMAEVEEKLESRQISEEEASKEIEKLSAELSIKHEKIIHEEKRNVEERDNNVKKEIEKKKKEEIKEAKQQEKQREKAQKFEQKKLKKEKKAAEKQQKKHAEKKE